MRINMTFIVEYATYFHVGINNHIENRVVSNLDDVIRMFSFF